MSDSPQEVLGRLRALHDFDSGVQRLDRDLSQSPQRLAEHQAAIDASEQKIARVEQAVKAVEVDIRIKTNEMRSNEKRIEGLKEKSSEVRTNKEYTAFRAEIANLQAEVDRIQGDILKRMEVVDEAKQKIAALTAERDERIARRRREKEEIENRLADVKAERDGKLTERAPLLEGLPKETLDIYERVRETRGRGMAVMEGNYCSACGEPQVKNDAYAVENRTRIVHCRACNVILFR